MRHLDRQRFTPQAIAVDDEGRWLSQNVALLESHIDDPSGLPIHPDRPVAGYLQGALAEADTGIPPVVFPIIHGSDGEDGSLQGLLEILRIPYVGCGVAASALGMDKALAKQLVRAAGIAVADGLTVGLEKWQRDAEQVVTHCQERFRAPLFVKPARAGSSVGVSRVGDVSQLREACELALRYDTKFVIEQGIDGREIEVAAIGSADSVEVSLPGEVAAQEGFYDYQSKYVRPNAARLDIPADLTSEQRDELQAAACEVFRALDLYGMARIDFFLERITDRIVFNEVNTAPGMTAISQFPQLWEASGMPPRVLMTRLIDLALARHASTEALDRRDPPLSE